MFIANSVMFSPSSRITIRSTEMGVSQVREITVPFSSAAKVMEVLGSLSVSFSVPSVITAFGAMFWAQFSVQTLSFSGKELSGAASELLSGRDTYELSEELSPSCEILEDLSSISPVMLQEEKMPAKTNAAQSVKTIIL